MVPIAAFCLAVGLTATSPTHGVPAVADTTTPVWGTLPESLEDARASSDPVLVYVSAPWCGPCLAMERDAFPAVEPLLHRLHLARLDFDDQETRLRVGEATRTPFDWARHLGIDATPGLVLLDPEGTPILREQGALDSTGLGVMLSWAATGAWRHGSFEEYARGLAAGATYPTDTEDR